MKYDQIRAINNRTLDALRENQTGLTGNTHPYFGFYPVDIFECPAFTMFTANDCPRAGDILYARSFEPLSMKIWCRLVRQATGILDIGAHVGVYSLAAAALRRDLIIHAFEPNPYAFARLREHKLINGFGHIAEHTVAAGNADKIVDFGWILKPSLQIASGAGIGRREGEHAENTHVRMVSLDGTGLAATLGSRTIIKIDVEGAEARVFQGMLEILALKPDIILETFNTEACRIIRSLIEPLGYNVYRIFEDDGDLEACGKLEPIDQATGKGLNQLLTMRNEAQLADILA